MPYCNNQIIFISKAVACSYNAMKYFVSIESPIKEKITDFSSYKMTELSSEYKLYHKILRVSNSWCCQIKNIHRNFRVTLLNILYIF